MPEHKLMEEFSLTPACTKDNLLPETPRRDIHGDWTVAAWAEIFLRCQENFSLCLQQGMVDIKGKDLIKYTYSVYVQGSFIKTVVGKG